MEIEAGYPLMMMMIMMMIHPHIFYDTSVPVSHHVSSIRARAFNILKFSRILKKNIGGSHCPVTISVAFFLTLSS